MTYIKDVIVPEHNKELKEGDKLWTVNYAVTDFLISSPLYLEDKNVITLEDLAQEFETLDAKEIEELGIEIKESKLAGFDLGRTSYI